LGFPGIDMRTQRDTIVIAEEDQATFAVLAAIFTDHLFQVERFTSLEAIRLKNFQDHPTVMILGDLGGVSYLKTLRAAGWDWPVIFLHSNHSVSEAVKAIQAGAANYFSRPFCPQTLLQSVLNSLAKARSQIELQATHRISQQRVASLTQREREIMRLALSGLLNKQIAEQLGLALVTVKVHRGSVMRKLGAKTAGELARIALELGVVETTGFTPVYQQHPPILARYQVATA
jgi:FixJ family two-component response regulator